MPTIRFPGADDDPRTLIAAHLLATGTPLMWPQLPTGATAFWLCGETAGSSRLDSTGNGNTLAETGGSVASAAGLLGNAASFSGTNYLSLAGTPVASGNFTFACWTNLADVATDYFLMGQGLTSNLRLVAGASGVKFGTASGANFVFSATVPTAGSWTHIAGTRASTTLKLYVNGVLRAAGAKTATYGSGFALGQSGDGAGVALNGLLQNAGVWPRALSDGGATLNNPVSAGSEIGVLYNGGLGHSYP